MAGESGLGWPGRAGWDGRGERVGMAGESGLGWPGRAGWDWRGERVGMAGESGLRWPGRAGWNRRGERVEMAGESGLGWPGRAGWDGRGERVGMAGESGSGVGFTVHIGMCTVHEPIITHLYQVALQAEHHRRDSDFGLCSSDMLLLCCVSDYVKFCDAHDVTSD